MKLICLYMILLTSLAAGTDFNMIRDEISEQIPGCCAEKQNSAVILLKGRTRLEKLLNGSVVLDIRVKPGKSILRGQATVHLSRNEQLESVEVGYRIECQSEVWRAVRPLKGNRILKNGDFEKANIAISRVSGAVYEGDRPVGKLLVRNLRRGEVLLRSDVKSDRAVRRGDEVVIQMEKQGLRIQDQGIALETGGISEKVKVQNSRTGKIIKGEVQGKGVLCVF